jgi:hypothetical protein
MWSAPVLIDVDRNLIDADRNLIDVDRKLIDVDQKLMDGDQKSLPFNQSSIDGDQRSIPFNQRSIVSDLPGVVCFWLFLTRRREDREGILFSAAARLRVNKKRSGDKRPPRSNPVVAGDPAHRANRGAISENQTAT